MRTYFMYDYSLDLIIDAIMAIFNILTTIKLIRT